MNENFQPFINDYNSHGFIAPVPLLAESEILNYQQKFTELQNHFNNRERFENLHLYFSWARELSAHPALLDMVQQLIGPEIIIMGSLILSKQPRGSSHLAWHQDGRYFKEYDSTPYVTAWIALTESNSENGCMRVIPGSHKQGLLLHVHSDDEQNIIWDKEEIQISPREEEIIDIILNPGEVSFHHAGLIHQSKPNHSGKERTGFIVRYVTSNLQKAVLPVLQVRGNDQLKHLPVLRDDPFESIDEGATAFINKVFETV